MLHKDAYDLVVELATKFIPLAEIFEQLEKKGLDRYIDEPKVRKIAREAVVAKAFLEPKSNPVWVRIWGMIMIGLGVAGIVIGSMDIEIGLGRGNPAGGGGLLAILGLMLVLKPGSHDTDIR